MTEKKEKKFCSKRMRKIAKVLLGLLILAMLAYGMVYAPMRQLQIAEGNLLINDQEIKLAEAKDIKRCQSLASQQLAIAVEKAKKDKQKITEADKKKFVENVYLNCLSLEARDYIVNQILAEQKKAEKAASKKTEDKK